MTRVIHTGDTHLGYRQYHRPERRADFLEAFRQVAADAVAGDVDAVVHAGDLFHDRRPDLGDIMGALSVLRTLDDAGIPVLAVVGNHEAKRSAQWLDLYESLGLATRLGSEPVVVGDTAFYGLDFVPRARRDDFEPDFQPHDADHAALVTHGLFEPFDFGEWDPREIFAASDVDFDALLLGDNHHPETAEVDGVWVTYCGSTERASAAEREDRGYNLVTFDEAVDIRRRGIDTREFVYVDLELGPGEGVERVRERVGQYDVADAVVVVHVEGDGEPIAPADVEEFALDRGALVCRVTDHREFPEEREREVSFADPDDAVRERVRELGLSDAARDVDETVRAGDVADSNVDEVVQERVADLVKSGDAATFTAAPQSDEAGDESGGSGDGDAPSEPDAPSDTGATAGNPSEDGSDEHFAEDGTDERPAADDEPVEDADGGGETADESVEPAAAADTPSDGDESDATLEDYL
jgi:DNA repair exonuclease SbcCD nuclease subunit